MADRNLQRRSETPVGNFSFNVEIQDAFGPMSLELPVDAVRGLGGSRTNIIRYRPDGGSATTQVPFPGISVPDSVTLEGSWFYDAGDLKTLQGWRNQVNGKVRADVIGGMFRDIVIMPVVRNEYGVSVDPASGGALIQEHITLLNCVATRLSVADFDVNAPAVSSWSLEVEFEEMKIGIGE